MSNKPKIAEVNGQNQLPTPWRRNAAARVFLTDEHERFLSPSWQRAVSEARVKQLISAIRRKNLLQYNPLMVRRKPGTEDLFEVLDGQHRLAAAKALDLEVAYIEIDAELEFGATDVAKLNSLQRTWRHIDYLVAFADAEEDVDYKWLLALHKDTRIGVSTLVGPVCGRGRDGKVVRAEFTAGDFKQPEWDVNGFIEDLKAFRSFNGWRAQRFVIAYLRLWNHPEYQHTVMKSKLEYLSNRVQRRATADETLGMLVELYNYRSRTNKIELASFADLEAA